MKPLGGFPGLGRPGSVVFQNFAVPTNITIKHLEGLGGTRYALWGDCKASGASGARVLDMFLPNISNNAKMGYPNCPRMDCNTHTWLPWKAGLQPHAAAHSHATSSTCRVVCHFTTLSAAMQFKRSYVCFLCTIWGQIADTKKHKRALFYISVVNCAMLDSKSRSTK